MESRPSAIVLVILLVTVESDFYSTSNVTFCRQLKACISAAAMIDCAVSLAVDCLSVTKQSRVACSKRQNLSSLKLAF